MQLEKENKSSNRTIKAVTAVVNREKVCKFDLDVEYYTPGYGRHDDITFDISNLVRGFDDYYPRGMDITGFVVFRINGDYYNSDFGYRLGMGLYKKPSVSEFISYDKNFEVSIETIQFNWSEDGYSISTGGENFTYGFEASKPNERVICNKISLRYR